MIKLILTASLIAATSQARPTSLAAQLQPPPRFQALSLIESGDDDNRIGTHGEVSRYQILPRVWRRASSQPVRLAKSLTIALEVAQAIMFERDIRFAQKNARMPDDREWALLWHCPHHALRPGQQERDYAERFQNTLRMVMEGKYAQKNIASDHGK